MQLCNLHVVYENFANADTSEQKFSISYSCWFIFRRKDRDDVDITVGTIIAENGRGVSIVLKYFASENF